MSMFSFLRALTDRLPGLRREGKSTTDGTQLERAHDSQSAMPYQPQLVYEKLFRRLMSEQSFTR